jgi:internalin A
MDDLSTHPATDHDLIRAFSRGDAAALDELARRHWGMVYGVCRRDLGDVHLAEDAAQAAFIVLAKKGAKLSPKVVIAGWLFKVARYAAADLKKMEFRRQYHERKAASMKTQLESMSSELNEPSKALLNSAVAALAQKDRDVVILRFFENQSISEIAATLGVAQDAARKRLSRAVDRLRSIFASHGILCPADAMETRLEQHEVAVIPPTLLATVSAGVAGHSTTAGASSVIAQQVIKRMLAAKLKLIVLAGAVVGAVAVPVTPLVYHALAGSRTVVPTVSGVPKLTAPVPAKSPPIPQPFEADINTTWAKAGAQSGWMNLQRGFYFGGAGVTGGPGDVPAFWVQDFMLGQISHLPVPDQHFGLELAYANLTDSVLKRLAEFTQLQRLDINSTYITDAGLQQLADLKQLQWLDISNTKVTDAGLRVLAGFRQLQMLDLGNTQVTDSGLAALAGLTQLQMLDLSNTQVTGTGLKELSGLTQLQSLNLAGTRMTDAGLKELSGLTQLQSLGLTDADVTNAGLKELAGLAQLQTLDLANNPITDAGLQELARLRYLQALGLSNTHVTPRNVLLFYPYLQALDLSNTHVTDASMKQLAGLTQLQSLDLSNTAVTDSGLIELAYLTQLQTLSLAGTHVTDTGLNELVGFTNLWSLDLTGARVTDAGLQQLADLTNLHELILTGTQVTGTGLSKLARLGSLHSLNLAGDPLTSTGLKKLADLKQLQIVNLEGDHVTDADLQEFVGHKQLRELDLKGTQVTEAGAAEFKKKMPYVYIIR